MGNCDERKSGDVHTTMGSTAPIPLAEGLLSKYVMNVGNNGGVDNCMVITGACCGEGHVALARMG